MPVPLKSKAAKDDAFGVRGRERAGGGLSHQPPFCAQAIVADDSRPRLLLNIRPLDFGLEPLSYPHASVAVIAATGDRRAASDRW
jgi:hypothetical protein